MAGLPAALAAFVGRDLKLTSFGWNAETLELAALAAFGLSFVFALKRLEVAVTLMRLNAGRLEHHEAAGQKAEASRHGIAINMAAGELYLGDDLLAASREHHERAQAAEAAQLALSAWAPRHYKLRNRLLVLGLFLLALSRVVASLP
jgi:hypothetical protein